MWDSLRQGGEPASLAKDHTINTLPTQKRRDWDDGTTITGFRGRDPGPSPDSEQKLDPEGPSWREPLSSWSPTLSVPLV